MTSHLQMYMQVGQGPYMIPEYWQTPHYMLKLCKITRDFSLAMLTYLQILVTLC